MWQHFKRNINGVSTEVYAMRYHVDGLKIGSLGNSSMYNSSIQGVNGTFYGSGAVYGVAIQDGAVVRTLSSYANNC